MVVSALTHPNQARLKVQRVMLLALLFMYIGAQSVMAFCTEQPPGQSKALRDGISIDCHLDEFFLTGTALSRQSDPVSFNCLEALNPENSPIKSSTSTYAKNAAIAADGFINPGAIISFAQLIDLTKALRTFDLSTSLFSQKTSLLFYA